MELFQQHWSRVSLEILSCCLWSTWLVEIQIPRFFWQEWNWFLELHETHFPQRGLRGETSYSRGTNDPGGPRHLRVMSSHWKWKAIWLRQYLGALLRRLRCHFFPAVGYNYWPCGEGAAVLVYLLMRRSGFVARRVEKEVKCCRAWSLSGRTASRAHSLSASSLAFHPRLIHSHRFGFSHRPPASSSPRPPRPRAQMMFLLTASSVSPRSPRQPGTIEFLCCAGLPGGPLPLSGTWTLTGSSCSLLVRSSSGHTGQNVSSLFFNGS